MFEDQQSPEGNYIKLHVTDKIGISFQGTFERCNDYVQRYLRDFGAELKIKAGFDDVNNRDTLPILSGTSFTGEDIPIHVAADATHARLVFDALFHREQISEKDRADIEPLLRRLEIAYKRALAVHESCSKAQKDIIQTFVAPYVDYIKSIVNDVNLAKELIRHVANLIDAWGVELSHNMLREECDKILPPNSSRDEDFYESVFAVARTYAGESNLESALEQSGAGLPSFRIINLAIDEFLSEAFSAKQ